MKKQVAKQINWKPLLGNTSSEEMIYCFAFEGDSLTELKSHYDAGVRKVAKALSAMPVSKARAAARVFCKRNYLA